jgi:sulfur-carrier protein
MNTSESTQDGLDIGPDVNPEIRVVLPGHLRILAQVAGSEVWVTPESVTLAGVIDALEHRYPALKGTIRDHHTGQRRAFVRFFACEEDLSHVALSTPLPSAVLTGQEPLLIVGAMAGG